MNGPKRMLASSHKSFMLGSAPDGMVRLVDVLGEAAMEFVSSNDDVVPGRYVVELRQDGSLISLKAQAEFLEPEDVAPQDPSLATLTTMYEQITASAEAYFAECGERPPLAADMYDRFTEAGFNMECVERIALDDPRGRPN